MYLLRNIKKSLSINLLSLREQKGWSQEQAAEVTGLSLRGYQDIERGINWPSFRNLERLAKGFKVDPFFLLFGAEKVEIPPDIMSGLAQAHHSMIREQVFGAIRAVLQGYGVLAFDTQNKATPDKREGKKRA